MKYFLYLGYRGIVSAAHSGSGSMPFRTPEKKRRKIIDGTTQMTPRVLTAIKRFDPDDPRKNPSAFEIIWERRK